MLKKEILFIVYPPPSVGLPFLSVILNAGRKYDLLVNSFVTAVEAEAFNHDMRIELRRTRSKTSVDKFRIPAITPDQARAARELLSWTRDRLSEAAGLGIRPITRFEMGDGIVKPSTVAVLRSALEAAGVEFMPATGAGAGVRMRKSEPMVLGSGSN